MPTTAAIQRADVTVSPKNTLAPIRTNSGEVITMPQIQTAAGKQALAMLKPGDVVNTVWTHQTAIAVKIIR